MNVKETFWTLFVAATIFAGCSSDDDGTPNQYANLKKVEFPEVKEQVLSSTPTGNVIGNKKELLQVVRYQMTLSPVELVDGRNTDVIFPGSVLRGDAFMEGEYSPVVIKNPTQVTISATLQGANVKASSKCLPVLSEVRQAINDLIYNNNDKINYSNTPAYLSYRSNEVTTTESFNKTFGIHAKVNVLGGIVKANFDYEENNYSFSSKKYVLIKVRQHLYNISMDPIAANDWGELSDVGEYEPVYVSSVDYGRVAHLLIETTESVDSISKLIKGGIDAHFSKIVSIDVKADYKTKITKLFTNKQIKIMIAGGTVSSVNSVRDYDSFMKFLGIPGPEELVQSSVPIGYKVRSLRNNREVEVRTLYTEKRLVVEE